MQKYPRFRFSIRFLFGLVMLLAVLLASRNTLLCNYHRWALDQTDSRRWYVGSFEGHIKELARLGRFEKRKFILKNLPVDSVEARRLFFRLRSVRGADAWITMGSRNSDGRTTGSGNIMVICSRKKMFIYQHIIEAADAAFQNSTAQVDGAM